MGANMIDGKRMARPPIVPVQEYGLSPRPRAALCLLSLCLLAFSCNLPFLAPRGGSERGPKGALELSFSDASGEVAAEAASEAGSARTILPASENITVQSYVLTASGPNGRALGPLVASSTSGHTFSSLAVGSWTFEAEGKNGTGGTGATVTEGSATVEIVPDETSSATIYMAIAGGTGSYSLVVEWPGLDSVVAWSHELLVSGGGAVDPQPTRTDGSSDVTLSGGGLPSGVYEFRVILVDEASDHEITVFEDMQIYPGFPSTKTITLVASDFSSPPAGLSSLSVELANRTAILAWTHDSNTENFYKVERNDGGAGWVLLTDDVPANATGYVDYSLDLPYASYYAYRVSAINAIGASAASDVNESPVRVTGTDADMGTATVSVGITGVRIPDVYPIDAFDKRLTYASSNPSIATVDSVSGLYTGVSPGSANIVATTMDGGFTGTCVLTVCSAPSISAYSFTADLNPGKGLAADCTGAISGGTISLRVPYGANLNGLIATFTTTGTESGASIKIGETAQVSGTTPIDFSNPKTYRVTVADGVYRDYTVHVTVAAEPGSFWSERAMGGIMSGQDWRDLAGSSDGLTLLAAACYDFLYRSTNGGATWSQVTNAGRRYWRSVASSADGAVLAGGTQGGYLYVSTDGGSTWAERQPVPSITKYWYGIACNADGDRMVAVEGDGMIFTSDDYGATWTQRVNDPAKDWADVASSSTGQHLVAADGNFSTGQVWISGDYGVNWTQSGNVSYCDHVAINSDGTRLASARRNGNIYISMNSGMSWTQQSFTTPQGSTGYAGWTGLAMTPDGTKILTQSNWSSGDFAYTARYDGVSWTWTQRTGSGARLWYQGVAMSDDGSRLVCIAQRAAIHTSSDGGATWTERTGAGSITWNDIAGTPDGTILYLAPGYSYLRKSTDKGATWTELSAAGRKNWRSIACSSDGTKLVAGCGENGLYDYFYTSTDGGVTWTQKTGPGSGYYWPSVAVSGDGSRMAAAAGSGYIWTSGDGGSSWAQESSPGSKSWKRIVMSPDGTKLAAAISSGDIWTATYSSGWSWTDRSAAGSRNWSGIDISPDGQKIAACVQYGSIWTSSNGGVSWTERASSLGTKYWNTLSMSDDGMRIIAASNWFDNYYWTASTSAPGRVYTSSDGGVTWKERGDAGSHWWQSTFASSDGTFFVVGAEKYADLPISGRDYYDVSITVD